MISKKEKIQNFGPGPATKTTFINGAVLLHHRPKGFKGAYACMWYQVGSRKETAATAGIVHLIEHMYFRGSTERTGKDITESIEGLGGEINAFTTKEDICFEVSSLSKRMKFIFPHFTELVLDPAFRAEDLEKEKNVVLQEMREDTDDFEMIGQEALFKKLFGLPLGHPIGGTSGNIKKFTSLDLKRFHQKHLKTSRLVVCVLSNDSPLGYEKILTQAFAKYGAVQKKSPEKVKLKLKNSTIKKFNITLRRECELASVNLAYPACSMYSAERGAFFLLNSYLADGMNSQLFLALREDEGLVYSLDSDLYSFSDTGVLIISACCLPANLKKVKAKIKFILKEIAAIGIEQSRLDELKRYFVDYLDLCFDRLEERSVLLTNSELYKRRIVTIKERKEMIKKVRVSQIQLICQRMNQNGASVVVVAPHKKKD